MSRTPPARLLLLPFAAFLVVLPLILNGCSCGHDFSFHIGSWLDAASQIRHGILLPRWDISAAWNSGEPRFLFYPPLSWLLGAVLALIFTPAAAPILFTWIALTAAAFTMYRLARDFTSSHIALLSAALYIVNPYMLFTAYERSAYGELLAAAWLPLLVAAALHARPRITAIALPIALLWLTNAPAAVIGCYAFAAIIAVRIVLLLLQPIAPPGTCHPERSAKREVEGPASLPRNPYPRRFSLELLLRSIAGYALGASLASFYLVPAAYERRFVQIKMAIIPNLRFQDNFLFGHTSDIAHNQVLHTASLIALTLLTLTSIPLVLLFLSSRKRSVILSEARSAESKDPEEVHTATTVNPFLTATPLTLITLTLIIAFCLTPLSTPLFNHLPELAFLQFPWRMLSLLGVVFALGVALLLQTSGGLLIARFHRAMSGVGTTLAVTTITLASTYLCISLFRQGCEFADQPAVHAQLFATGHGGEPTDEYTPANADNDTLRTGDPGYWLSTGPQAFAPNTIPNPIAVTGNYDETPPLDQTISTPAPRHFTVHTDKAEFLILNLRDYPSWDITETDNNNESLEHPPHIFRDDGLIAIPLYYAADHTIDITWRRTTDQLLGLILTTLALFTLGVLSIYSYRTQN
jgi:hypothetical protein